MLKKREEILLHKEMRSKFEFDELKMLACRDYVTQNGGITIREPRMGEIIDIGEKEFYKNVNIWITNPTAYRVSLWHMDADWCKITDFELFCSLYKAMDQKIMSLVTPNLDLTLYEPKFRVLGEDEYEPVLYSVQLDQVIDNAAYLEVSQYLRTLFNIFPKDEYAKGKATKEAIIWEEEEKLRNKQEERSMLFPLISACVNHPGFKYKLEELDNVGIFAFMNAVSRLQIYENSVALIRGSVSGMADMSKVDKELMNFMRDVNYSAKKKTNNGNEAKDNSTFNNVVNNLNKR